MGAMPRVFVAKETRLGETRVAATPETVKKMVKAGLTVAVESGAGRAAGFSDKLYADAGAEVGPGGAAALEAADLVLRVTAPDDAEISQLRSGAILAALLDPYRNVDLASKLAARGVSAFALELVPRVTRAQDIDVLSSQASISGYKAVVLAAARLGKYFPLLMTAAGTIQPARVVVLGAGVAGLQALATAKRLGAVVEVSDIRAAVKEQVESLGGKFIELPEMPSGEGQGGYAMEMTAEFLEKQRALLTQRIALADVVITTAQVPGKRAPTLLTRAMVEVMKPGSVVIDIAAAQGGNCELTRVDEEVDHGGVLILGPGNLPATVAHDASLVYSRNLLALLTLLWKDGQLAVREDDEVVRGTLLTHGGQIVNKAVADLATAAKS